MQNQSLYVIKGEKLYKNGQMVGNRQIHILDSKKLQVRNGKYVLNSLLLNKLKNKNTRKNQISSVSNQVLPASESLEEEPPKKYTYELSETDAYYVLSKYPTAKNSGIIYITNVVLNTLSNDTTTTVTRDLPFYNAFSLGTYLVLGKTYSLTVTICDINITYPAAIVSVWIDWNQTNSYNEEDWIQVTSNTPIGESATVEIVVPMTAKIGTTGMRIRSRGASGGNKNSATDAYVDMGSGDTQDYPITILSEEL